MPHGTALLQRPLLFQSGTPTISIVLFRLGGDTPVASEVFESRDVPTMMSFNSSLLARPWEKCQSSPDRHLMHSQGRPEFVFATLSFVFPLFFFWGGGGEPESDLAMFSPLISCRPEFLELRLSSAHLAERPTS